MVPKAGNIMSVDMADIDTMRANISVNSITESLLWGFTLSLITDKLLALWRSYNHPIHFIARFEIKTALFKLAFQIGFG